MESCLKEVWRTLEPGGLVFVTFNSTTSDDWGKGRRVDDNTYIKVGGVEDGIPHYFVDRGELERLMETFEVLRISHKDEWLPELGKGHREAHWAVWARRP